MPKMKTDSGAKKRFKITGSGKILRRKAFKNHLLEKKSPTRKNRLSQEPQVSPADLKQVKRLLGR
ncbi:MAG: 50S ribosomal protein L35 [Actinobacteria bacterium]|jgi:large subunit ribosomal protein L35|nr:50S ribosomal protein L35 [Actinomycetota bacterium]MBV8959544.1 50S ribosomal protein L35 [Actinomycetota bacterium]MBV9666046.1 50S ribosomal protein L35 [Actinomycetota bacterium]MBV9934896.1 50S ribosomal protein L35 [Actinomycetota bacterium]